MAHSVKSFLFVPQFMEARRDVYSLSCQKMMKYLHHLGRESDSTRCYPKMSRGNRCRSLFSCQDMLGNLPNIEDSVGENYEHFGGRRKTRRVSSGWWFGTFFIFPYIGNVIIPIDELIFFRGVQTTKWLISHQTTSDVMWVFTSPTVE